MFDLGWTELLLIGIVALIVVGPKDLPVLFRNAGRFVGKARGMAREFSRAMEEAADESGAKDISKTFRDAVNPKKMGLDKLKEATDFRNWEPDSETGKLAEDRAAAAKKIHAATAAAAEKRKAQEAETAAQAKAAAEATPDAGQGDAPADPAPAAPSEDTTRT
ncbi:preprotein translocase subunit TatB [Oceanicola sp. 22II-s10i]|uniref:Sec-independent protein translocase protein TatB n=1 Tax=Oceanicola sp. 22II-s10i TaxID=1317116 RepID=UPI000B522BEB|nr:Sec-independent protein translocase protein TatB [Oceanicola sp. 22II-s10i]OWU84736.1 preprotein translocase subunit TatB [Oceanicola sp. 22II-s10i]